MTSSLAELNIGRLLAPKESPIVAEFIEAIDRVNGIAKRSPGFIWMMEGSGAPNEGNLSNNIGDDEQIVANLSVWQNFESLENFVHKTVHRQFLARRKAWFEMMDTPSVVLWQVNPIDEPSLDEAIERLEYMRAHGDSEYAFGWQYAKANLMPGRVVQ